MAKKTRPLIADRQIEHDPLQEFVASRWSRIGVAAAGAALLAARLGGIAHAYDHGGDQAFQPDSMAGYDPGYDSPQWIQVDDKGHGGGAKGGGGHDDGGHGNGGGKASGGGHDDGGAKAASAPKGESKPAPAAKNDNKPAPAPRGDDKPAPKADDNAHKAPPADSNHDTPSAAPKSAQASHNTDAPKAEARPAPKQSATYVAPPTSDDRGRPTGAAQYPHGNGGGNDDKPAGNGKLPAPAVASVALAATAPVFSCVCAADQTTANVKVNDVDKFHFAVDDKAKDKLAVRGDDNDQNVVHIKSRGDDKEHVQVRFEDAGHVAMQVDDHDKVQVKVAEKDRDKIKFSVDDNDKNRGSFQLDNLGDHDNVQFDCSTDDQGITHVNVHVKDHDKVDVHQSGDDANVVKVRFDQDEKVRVAGNGSDTTIKNGDQPDHLKIVAKGGDERADVQFEDRANALFKIKDSDKVKFDVDDNLKDRVKVAKSDEDQGAFRVTVNGGDNDRIYYVCEADAQGVTHVKVQLNENERINVHGTPDRTDVMYVGFDDKDVFHFAGNKDVKLERGDEGPDVVSVTSGDEEKAKLRFEDKHRVDVRVSDHDDVLFQIPDTIKDKVKLVVSDEDANAGHFDLNLGDNENLHFVCDKDANGKTIVNVDVRERGTVTGDKDQFKVHFGGDQKFDVDTSGIDKTRCQCSSGQGDQDTFVVKDKDQNDLLQMRFDDKTKVNVKAKDLDNVVVHVGDNDKDKIKFTKTGDNEGSFQLTGVDQSQVHFVCHEDTQGRMVVDVTSSTPASPTQVQPSSSANPSAGPSAATTSPQAEQPTTSTAPAPVVTGGGAPAVSAPVVAPPASPSTNGAVNPGTTTQPSTAPAQSSATTTQPSAAPVQPSAPEAAVAPSANPSAGAGPSANPSAGASAPAAGAVAPAAGPSAPAVAPPSTVAEVIATNGPLSPGQAAAVANVLGGGLTGPQVQAMSPGEIQSAANASGVSPEAISGAIAAPVEDTNGMASNNGVNADQGEATLGEQFSRGFDNVVASVMPSTGEPALGIFAAGLAALGGAGLFLRRIGRR